MNNGLPAELDKEVAERASGDRLPQHRSFGVLSYSFAYFPLMAFLAVSTILPRLTPARLLLGVLALVLVPGYLLMRTVNLHKFLESQLGFSLILGLILQIVNVDALFVADTLVGPIRFDFWAFTILVSLLEITVMVLYVKPELAPRQVRAWLGGLTEKRPALALFGLFLAALLGNLYFQSLNSSSMLPDGGLYQDIARTIVSGKFSSLVVNDGLAYAYQNQAGLSAHIGTAFFLSFFFQIGEVCYEVAKLAVSLVGALLVYVSYEGARLYFNRRVALMAGAIVAVLPLFRYYSAILFGPEILSALLAFVSLVFLSLALRSRRFIFFAFSGLTLFLTSFVSSSDTVPLFLTFGLMFIFFNNQKAKVSPRRIISAVLEGLPFILLLFGMLLSAEPLLWLSILALVYVLLVVSYFLVKEKNVIPLAGVIAAFTVLTQVYYLRTYLNTAANGTNPAVPGFLLSQTITASSQQVLDRFSQVIWPNLNLNILPLLVYPALISIPWLIARRIWPFFFYFLSWFAVHLFLLPEAGFTADNSRFYISAGLALAVMSAYAFISIFDYVTPVKIRAAQRLIGDIRIGTSSLAAFLLTLLLLSSWAAYVNGAESFNMLSSQANGWSPILHWISTNTGPTDVFLTTGPERLWAWMSDREFAGAYVVRNGALLSPDQVGSIELSDLIHTFNVSYVIFDSTVQSYGLILAQFAYLYRSYSPGYSFKIVGTGTNLTLQTMTSSTSDANPGGVYLYKVIAGG